MTKVDLDICYDFLSACGKMTSIVNKLFILSEENERLKAENKELKDRLRELDKPECEISDDEDEKARELGMDYAGGYYD